MDIQILGNLQVVADDRSAPLAVPSGQQCHLLTTLVLREGTIVPRAELIDVLWWGEPTRSAAIGLRGLIKAVRDLLEPDRPARSPSSVLLARGAGYVLTIGRGQLDAFRFEDGVSRARSALARGDLATAATELGGALGIWRGPALDGLEDLPAAVPRARWWNELRVRAWEMVAEVGLDRGRHAEVVPRLQQLVAEHPLSERFAQLLVVALYRCGRQADALAVLARVRAALRDELGVAPGPELARTEQGVLEQAPWLHAPVMGGPGGARSPDGGAGAGGAGGEGAPGAGGGLPRSLLVDAHDLVGRDAELAESAGVWSRALEGRAGLLVVEGEAGVGKSRLLAELAREVAESGAVVLHGRCDEDLRVPYGPMAEAVTDLLERVPSERAEQLRAAGGAPLTRILPGPGGRAPVNAPGAEGPRDAEPERYQLLEAVAQLFGAVAAGAPALVVLDDLQWADPASLQLLRHLLARAGTRRLLVAASVRTPVAPTALVAEVLLDARRKGLLHRLALGGLGAGAVRRLLSLMVDGVEDGAATRVARVVHQLSEGNPFFARELFAHLRATSTLDALASGALPADAAGLPVEVQVLVGRRMGRLPAESLDILRSAAVIGPEPGLDLLAQVTERSVAELQVVVDEAYEAGLVVDVPGAVDRFTFHHALIRHTLYGDLPPGRRARLHRRVGDALEARALARHVPLGDLARHFSRAGPGAVAKALDYCERAGAEALGVAAYEDAVTYFEDALRVTSRSGEAALRARLLVSLGRARMAATDPVGARSAYAQAANLAASADRPELLADAALGYGSEWSFLGDYDESFVVLLDRAIAATDGDNHARRSLLLGRRAMATFHRAGAEHAADDCRGALAAASLAADDAVVASARHVEHEINWHNYAAEHRLALAGEVIALARRAGAVTLELNGLSDALTDHLQLGRTGDAQATWREFATLARRIRRPVSMWWAAVVEAAIAVMTGPLDQAERLVHGAHATGTELRVDDAARIHLVQLFTLRWQQGRLAELADLVALAGPPAPGGPGALWLLPRALIELAAGDERAARATFAVVLDDLDGIPRDSAWVGQLVVAAELAWLLRDDAAAGTLLGLLLPLRHRNVVVGPGAALLGPLDRSIALAAAGRGDVALALDLITRAASACEAMGAPTWRARTLADHAAILRGAGQDGPAADELETAARRAGAEVGGGRRW